MLHCIFKGGIVVALSIRVLICNFKIRSLAIRRLVLKVELKESTSVLCPRIGEPRTHWIEYDSYYQTAARARRDVFAIRELAAGDLEAVAAGAGVVIYTLFWVPDHVLDFYFVVICPHGKVMWRFVLKNIGGLGFGHTNDQVCESRASHPLKLQSFKLQVQIQLHTIDFSSKDHVERETQKRK